MRPLSHRGFQDFPVVVRVWALHNLIRSFLDVYLCDVDGHLVINLSHSNCIRQARVLPTQAAFQAKGMGEHIFVYVVCLYGSLTYHPSAILKYTTELFGRPKPRL